MSSPLLNSATLAMLAVVACGAMACGPATKGPEAPIQTAGLDASAPPPVATAAPEPAAPVAPAPVWQDVEAPTCNARAKMLGTPKETTQTITTDAGPAKLTMLMYEAPGGAWAMGLTCSETAQLKTSKTATDHWLDTSRDGIVKNVKGTLTSEKPLTIGGFPAREIVVRAKATEVQARIVLMRHKGKTLTLIAVGVDEQNARTFLESVSFGR